ncbi:unnamed protein product [Heligmosomoides polygyrus]|uniref:Uncharacterized protein n=1 Tax=Heligmosomoides polygyrus TaxID=6339 RepID=A0A183GCC9_HELPZ|nr:unnamed protein product [Heligmosomoides polygyrus]
MSRITHLEQTGVSLNADRVWRRLILSKFTEYVCSSVITKERNYGTPLDVKGIIEAIDEIITLQETTELTTATLFDNDVNSDDEDCFSRQNGLHHFTYQSRQSTLVCLYGETQLPQHYNRFTTPQ